ncbi:MAG TPA: tRNA pseudouridine(38-40) synthase TruA [Bacteroidetes bacterium]|nr:tRNA pseudouridine(38-40) synthase TruA [Bacteroidota bacterium]
MRYFAEIAYNGTNYHGWQKQPNAPSVQEVVEQAFSTILNTPIEVIGCGRTDAGVHALQYFFHFDFEGEMPKGLPGRLNRFLPNDIAVRRVFEVDKNRHARFDAVRRSYEYRIVFEKNPFEIHTTWHYHQARSLNIDQLNGAASLLRAYHAFFPFCKSHHDAQTMACDLARAEWVLDEKQGRLTFHITANRFLRGMVRLVVGMCINVAEGKLPLEKVKQALDNQQLLEKSRSVPPGGLFLSRVEYP